MADVLIEEEESLVTKEQNRFFQIMADKMNLDESTAMEIADLYESWAAGSYYEAGKFVKYGVRADEKAQLYIVLENHTAAEGSEPGVADVFYKAIGSSSSGYPIWVRPLDSTFAYSKDDVVLHGDSLWISTCGDNVEEPGIPGGANWKVYK